MRVGEGYWKKLQIPVLNYAGLGIDSLHVGVAARWNLTGSISSPVSVTGITSNPPGLVTSNFFGYDGSSYVVAESLLPGRAYWVRVGGAGELILNSTGPSTLAASPRIRFEPGIERPPQPPEEGNGPNVIKAP